MFGREDGPAVAVGHTTSCHQNVATHPYVRVTHELAMNTTIRPGFEERWLNSCERYRQSDAAKPVRIPRSIHDAMGSTNAAPIVAMSPASPMMMLIGVTVFRPSVSVMPLILQMTQKPLSAIQATGFDPHPIARAK